MVDDFAGWNQYAESRVTMWSEDLPDFLTCAACSRYFRIE
jgi:hypothetical protein